jgi:hypothetical protein
MNRINAEPHALNHMKRTSLGRPSPSRRVLVASLATVGLGSVPIQVAHAAEVQVSCTANDLINAISNAASRDFLSLAEGCIYTLAAANTSNSDPNLGDNGLPVIKITLTIKGNGATITRQQSTAAVPKFRIFQVAPGGDLTLSDLTVDNGDADGSGDNTNNQYRKGRGGGVYNLGALKVINSTFSRNHVSFGGGAIGNGDATEFSPTPAPGNLTLSDNSVVSGNSVGVNGSGKGGGIANGFTSTMDLTRCTISGNTGSGIANQGTAILNKCTVSGNMAPSGAGIFSIGHMILTDSPVTGNTATDQTGGFGGGIVTFAESQRIGMAILVTAGTTTLVRSPVAGNGSPTNAGGIANLGTMMLIDSPVTGNSAKHDGGGIGNEGGPGNIGSMTLAHSPVTGNSAMNDGGGIANEGGGAIVVLDHSPVTGNSAVIDGGGIYNQNGNTVTLSNSAVKGNSPPNCTGASGC